MSEPATFPAKKIAQLRRRASTAAELPDEVPEGWSKSAIDPMAVLALFKPLRIKDGYVLRAYQFRSGGNGNGFVWAMPVDAEFPDPEECPRQKGVFLAPPKPPLALDNVMDAIDGDGSPWSYMCASILARELAEFGAMWHGCDWNTHRILDANPWEDNEDTQTDGVTEEMPPTAEREWIQPKPTHWKPQVVSEGEQVIVTFLTYSGLGQEAIYQHRDVYTVGSYKFEADRQEVARGAGGFVF